MATPARPPAFDENRVDVVGLILPPANALGQARPATDSGSHDRRKPASAGPSCSIMRSFFFRRCSLFLKFDALTTKAIPRLFPIINPSAPARDISEHKPSSAVGSPLKSAVRLHIGLGWNVNVPNKTPALAVRAKKQILPLGVPPVPDHDHPPGVRVDCFECEHVRSDRGIILSPREHPRP